MSPPGGGIVTSPKRASSGPARRKEARIRAARSSSTTVVDDVRRRGAGRRCRRATRPRRRASRRIAICASVSRIRGTLRRIDVLLREQAGGEDRQGRVLVAGGDDLPAQGSAALNHEFLQSLARVDDGERAHDERARPVRRPGNCFASGPPPTPCASTRWRSRRRCAPTPGSGVRTRSATRSRASSTTSTTSASPTPNRPSADRAWPSSSGSATRTRSSTAVAGHADYLGVSPRDAAGEDAVRGRRALGLRHRLRARPADRDRGDEGQVGAQEAEAAVVRRQGRSRADRPRDRGARASTRASTSRVVIEALADERRGARADGRPGRGARRRE